MYFSSEKINLIPFEGSLSLLKGQLLRSRTHFLKYVAVGIF